jgi:hypothetical protein
VEQSRQILRQHVIKSGRLRGMETTMSRFTQAEIDYLQSQRLA